MSLTAKVLVIPALAVVAYALLDSAIQSRTLMPSFYQLELREARRDIYRSTSVFRHERESLGRTTADWAAWDDTYEFVADPCEEYITSNLVSATYIDNGLNAMVLLDPNGRRAHSLVQPGHRHRDLGPAVGQCGGLDPRDETPVGQDNLRHRENAPGDRQRGRAEIRCPAHPIGQAHGDFVKDSAVVGVW